MRRSSRPALGLLLGLGCLPAAAFVSGCAGPPKVEVSELVADATGVAEPIRFDVTGGPTEVDEPQPDVLRQSDVVQAALRHDPRVQAAIARVYAALAEAKQTRLLPNPVLSVVVRFPEEGGSVSVDAGLTADLVSLLRKPRESGAADHRLRAAAAEAITVALDVVAEAQQTYAEAQSLDANVGVIEGRLKLNNRLLDVAKSRLEAGESGRLDVLSLDAERVELEAEGIRGRADATEKRLTLTRLIGRPSAGADWKLDPFTAPPDTPTADERMWIRVAMSRRPELQAAQWELAALGDDVALAGLTAWDGTEAGVEAERDDGEWAVGPAVSVPVAIFDWGQQKRAKAEAQRVEARHRATEARRQVVEDVRRAVARLVAARAALAKVDAELLPLQQSRHEQAEDAYKAGVADVTALLVAEQDLQGSRSTHVELEKDVAVALIRLQRAVGGAGVMRSTTQPTSAAETQPSHGTRSEP